ncbi:dipeptide ABC transporter ATP-binding protein [Sanguibacter suaedae]|uniref:ABC transporter ATP-binding protein n=1 Tax=Sanguibacter suaedae TaxID=2795737 RepID=A0A934I6M4_9MICO|nr:ABC transporter ATP-binding protein [Sanguibacter suaedae]MBI9115201.1 ABC transporter ATP-binding protein [Sanguibacter suaedae]
MTQSHAQEPLLEIRDLDVSFTTANGEVPAVRGANLTIYPGQSVAIVGESGSGKSTTAHAIISLLPGTGRVTGGSIRFEGTEITTASKQEIVDLRGRSIGLVPQDPMSNLNPVWSIGFQVKEALRANNVDVTRGARKGLESALVTSETAVADGDRLIGRKSKSALLDVLRRSLLEGHDGKPPVSQKTADAAVRAADARIVVGSTTRLEAVNALEDAGMATAGPAVDAQRVSADLDDRVAGLLAEAGLPDALRRAKQYPHEFSGGMRQRALIAIGLAARPKLLIADEPTSALDVTVQRTILDHLEGLTRELGTAVLFITHDLGLAAERAEHLVVMYRGKVVESGPSRQILADPRHPYTQRLVAAAPSLASRRIQSAKQAGVQAKELKATTGGTGAAGGRDDVVVVKNLTKVFQIRGSGKQKDFKAVDDVSFSLERGTTMALVGESGSGKSTVANIMLNLLEPTEGSIHFDGVDLSTLGSSELFDFRRRVQPIFQNPYGSLDPMYSIFRTIEEPLRIHKVGSKKEREQRVRELLDMVALPQSTMRRFPNELSGGQRQRIAIARALALRPEVIVCDEAVSALDVLVQAQILELLNDLQTELGLSYLFITHDLAVVRQIADRVCVMKSGRIIEAATTDEVFDTPREEYTRELLGAIPGANLDVVPAGLEGIDPA